MTHTVVGLFEKSENAHKAADELINSGISFNNIDIAGHEGVGEDRKSRDEDGIRRFFNSLFGDTEERENYARVASYGTIIITVHCGSKAEAEKASQILDQYGAEDVGRKARELEGDTYTDTIPVIEEEMEVGKKSVDTGGVRIRSRIIEKPISETIRLRTENLSVERTPVNRKATEKEMENFKDVTIEASEKKEVPLVSKEARVVEEVKLKKDVSEKEETIRGSVKRQDVDVDKTKKGKEQY